MNHKILVVEDDESIRRLLRYELRQLGYDVSTAEDGKEGLDKALKTQYDIIVVDWMLPQLSGVELVMAYRKQNQRGIVVMLTAKNDEDDLMDAFEAGVDDYLTKPFSPRELGARIKAHLRRNPYQLTERYITHGNLNIDLDEHKVYVNQGPIDLTKKEFDLLIYLLKNINEFLSRDQILNEIWNFEYDGDTRIVDVHIFKLRNKLEDANLTIESLRGVGYAAKTK